MDLLILTKSWTELVAHSFVWTLSQNVLLSKILTIVFTFRVN